MDYEKKADKVVTACYEKNGRTGQTKIIALALREAAAEAFEVVAKHAAKECPYCKGSPLYGCACQAIGSFAAARAASLRSSSGEGSK